MRELDGTRFGLLKGIQEAERIQAAREAEVSKLREELRTLEATDVTDEVGLDGVAYAFSFPFLIFLWSCLLIEHICSLRLKICKDLGFDVITNKATGESRMIVRESLSLYDTCETRMSALAAHYILSYRL